MIAFLCTTLVGAEEETASQLDLQLAERGQNLYQSVAYGPAEAPRYFFLLKHVFPAGASERTAGELMIPSLESSDQRYRLYGTLGQTTTGRSEDTANFRVMTGFFANSRKSSFRTVGVRERRRPIVVPRR